MISNWMALLCQVHNMLELNRIKMLKSDNPMDKAILNLKNSGFLNNFGDISDGFKKDVIYEI